MYGGMYFTEILNDNGDEIEWIRMGRTKEKRYKTKAMSA